MGYKTHDYAGIRSYNLMSAMIDGYTSFCCGWLTNGTTGIGTGNSPTIAPKAFKAAALANALLTLRTETELQPEANKPYFGPYFTTDAHFSSTYGNELQIVCGSESPYGSFQVTLPRISGGSMLKYILTGFSLSVSVMGGNPATDTASSAPFPARQPPMSHCRLRPRSSRSITSRLRRRHRCRLAPPSSYFRWATIRARCRTTR